MKKIVAILSLILVLFLIGCESKKEIRSEKNIELTKKEELEIEKKAIIALFEYKNEEKENGVLRILRKENYTEEFQSEIIDFFKEKYSKEIIWLEKITRKGIEDEKHYEIAIEKIKITSENELYVEAKKVRKGLGAYGFRVVFKNKMNSWEVEDVNDSLIKEIK